MTSAVASVLVKVFKQLYLLSHWREVVHTGPDDMLDTTIHTRISDLEVKVMDLEGTFV